MSIDHNTFLTRLQRHTQTTGGVGRYLATWLGGAMVRSSGDAAYHHNRAHDLVKLLGGLKGPMMKVGQLLSMAPDLIPEPYARALQTLWADAPAMGPYFVTRRLRAELGDDWTTRFASFDRTPWHAASLGQVHRATSLSGIPLAVKLQYPNVETMLAVDFPHMRDILTYLATTYGGLDVDGALDEIHTRLGEELNYDLEAKRMALFTDLYRTHSFIHVPEVLEELSTRRLLAMTRLEGESLSDILETSQASRNCAAERLITAWFLPFFKHHLLHGDPHPGNFSFREDGGINLYDFGCVRVFDVSFVRGVIQLYNGLLAERLTDQLEALDHLGFQGLTKAQSASVLKWAAFLFEPFLHDRVRPINHDDKGVRGKGIMKTILDDLRTEGQVTTLPPAFVLLDRAAVGMGSACLKLRASCNWYRLLNELIGG